MFKRVRKLSGFQAKNEDEKEKEGKSGRKKFPKVVDMQPLPRQESGGSSRVTKPLHHDSDEPENIPKATRRKDSSKCALTISDDLTRDRRELLPSTTLSVADPGDGFGGDFDMAHTEHQVPGRNGGSNNGTILPGERHVEFGSIIAIQAPNSRRKTSSSGKSSPKLHGSPSRSRSPKSKSCGQLRVAQSLDEGTSKVSHVHKGIMKYDSAHGKLAKNVPDQPSIGGVPASVVSPTSTSIIITQPSSSSPSPTNPNKGIKVNQTNDNINNLSVSCSNSSPQIGMTEATNTATEESKADQITDGESVRPKVGSPKKLSFIAPPDVVESLGAHRVSLQDSNLKSGWSQSHPSLHTSALRSPSFSLYSPYASRTFVPPVHGAKKRGAGGSAVTIRKHHSLSSVPQGSSTPLAVHKKFSMPASHSTLSVAAKTSGRGAVKTMLVRKCHSFSSSYHSPLTCPVRRSSMSLSRSGNRSHPVSPKRKPSSVYLAVSSCVCCRIRSQEGSGLTIRIPRPLNDRGTSPPRAVSSCSPPAVPRYAQLTTSRYAYMAPLTMPGSAAPVPKSKSLSTSMDKLPYGFHHHMSPSSRGSTPSSGRSSSTAPPSAATSRPPSRRSPSAASALGATHPTAPSCRDKSRSPCGSEVSLNSGVSSSTSVKSLPSVRSNSSASGGRSSVSAARPSPTKASQHQSPTNNAVETVHGSLACRGKVPCGSKVSIAENTSHGRNSNRCSPVYRGANSVNNGTKINASKTNGCSKPSIVATHRKNAVVTRPVGIADGCVNAEPGDSVGLSGGEAGSNEFQSPASMPHEPSSSPPTAAPSLPGTNTTPKRRSASCTTAEVSYSPSPTARKMTTMCDANKGQQQSSGVAKKGLPVFNSYMSLFQVQEKLKKGEVIEGVLRINPKNYEDAYISAPGGGTDIYIGGVRDRNAALHGDVVAVELLPSDQWKVLYDQLDYFLDTDETLKSLVYASHDPFAVMDQFVAPGCSASPPAKSTQDETKSADNNETNAAEETASESAVQKKKKKRRGKKKVKQEKPGENDDMAAAAADVVAALLIDPPPQNVQDELYLLSDGTNKDVNNAASSAVVKSKSNKKKKTTIVVPPDMLSECSDVTDDESCCSDNLDLDTAVEDRSFYNAQRTAINKAIKVTNSELGVADRDISGLKPANIVEVQDDGIKVKTEPEIPESIKLEEVPGMKEDAFIKCVQDEDGRLANDNKKRQSTVERLFGDKVKSKTGVKERSLKEDVQEDNVGNVKALISEMSISETVDAGKTEESESGAKTSALDGTETSDMDSRDSNKPCGFADTGHGFGLVSAPPRFMISPYNQQMNFNHNLSRAENNWMHHPMLNNFSNSPASSQVIMGSQPRHRGQIRPQNQQFKPRQPMQEQQQPLPQPIEKRTVPSVAQVMRLANWSRFVQKIGYVVHILEQRNTRLGAGTLKPFQDLNPNFALFSPNDSRIPRMKIPMSQCPQDLIARRNDYAKRIHLAKITLWTDPKFAMGELISDIGRQGDISAESDAFLLQIGIDTSDFPAEVVAQLPDKEWTIPPEALQGRRDLRDECILTIDPPTARDLDDALSCEPLPNGHFRVGVHIADVSYFVPLDSELDKIAASRATSVYLIDKVISMLPRKLCEDLCSLNPDEDRLTFSVVWEMDPQGQIVSCWFGRSIIRSCAKLSYEHAQKVIDYPEKTTWSHDEFPVNARFSSAKVSAIINTLYKLSVEMRARRHHHGALRLDQRKLGFSLDPITKKPNAVHNVEHLASNAMIEEFMLLANISVAHKIYESFPKHAVLRCHPAPQQGQLDDIVNMLRTLNIEIDSSSAGAIYASVLELSGEDSYSLARLEVIVNLLSKPMQNALYFCSGTYEEDFCHYALNVPFYTHFTSPIRRYPDIMVHRLLAAAVDRERYPFPSLELKEIDRRLATANEKKISAKRASDYSAELFLAEFVRQVKEITTNGMVIGVLDRSLDILLLDYCTIKRAYLERLPLDELNYDNKNKLEPPTVHIIWSADHANQVPAQAQSLTYFSCVKVLLTPFTNDQLKFNVTLIRPDS